MIMLYQIINDFIINGRYKYNFKKKKKKGQINSLFELPNQKHNT